MFDILHSKFNTISNCPQSLFYRQFCLIYYQILHINIFSKHSNLDSSYEKLVFSIKLNPIPKLNLINCTDEWNVFGMWVPKPNLLLQKQGKE